MRNNILVSDKRPKMKQRLGSFRTVISSYVSPFSLSSSADHARSIRSKFQMLYGRIFTIEPGPRVTGSIEPNDNRATDKPKIEEIRMSTFDDG